MYMYLLSYYSMPQSKGSVIGPSAAAQVFPNFALCDDPYMTTEALCAEVRKNRIALEANEKIDKVRELLASDPVGACAMMHQMATELLSLGSGKATDVHFGSAYDQFLTQYQLKKSGVNLAVASFPWPILEKVTRGIQKDDYIVFYGRPKSYKTWVLAYLVSHLFLTDKRLVIYTKEMTAENIFSRIIACLNELPYQETRTGELSALDEERLYQTRWLLHYMQSEDRVIVLNAKDAPPGGDTVPWVTSKLKVYQPDACVIDGLYLMSDIHKNKDKHSKVQSISNDIRQMTLETHIPVLATLQANRKAAGHKEANFDELAFSDAIGQDATMVGRVINEKENKTAMIVLAGAREYDLNGFRIHAEPAINFRQYGTKDEDALITNKDIEKAKEGDVGDAPGHSANGHSRTYSKGLQPSPQPVSSMPVPTPPSEKAAGQYVERDITSITNAYSARHAQHPYATTPSPISYYPPLR
jgi:hypothetical protein